jgi:hypothetical protein
VTNGREEIQALMSKIRAVTTKEEARAVAEAEAEGFLARTPCVPIDIWRAKALNLIGYMTGSLDRREANRILDLFETEHPWRDREGNISR